MSYGGAVLLVAVATGAGVLGRRHLAPADLVMLYLLAIAVAAARLGRGPSLVGSALSVLAYDVFLVPPFYTIKVEDERHLLTFAMMFLVGLVTSHLTQRIRREAELAKSADLRARTEEMRSSLLSAVSHDLRTPLAAITGAASTLRSASDALDSGQRADLVDAICVESERLNRLVRNLLDMTRLESGAVQIQRDWVPLDEVVASALGRLDDQLSGRPVRADIPDALPLVSVDPVLLEQLFVNLLDNVVRHTPPAAAVTITARHDVSTGVVQVDVVDDGPGLPPGDEQRVFQKFFRGRGSAADGAGLGLAICRAIATVHGGTLVAQNRPEGGARFRLELPQVGVAPPLPDAEPEADVESGVASRVDHQRAPA
jgi:two-component system, OmpR family, sensor histidine kinase KdpD